MTPLWKFRCLILLIVLIVGSVSIANLAAEVLRPSAVAPFRSDVRGDYAVALANQVLGSAQPEQAEAAQKLRSALRIGPHDSQLWLVLALLQARSTPVDPRVSESLKMSYLTGPNRADLIPLRLQAVTSNNSLDDPDLAELARGDVRAMLTQLPQQRPMLLDDYARASIVGKKFLEESVGSIDPGFVLTLRGTP